MPCNKSIRTHFIYLLITIFSAQIHLLWAIPDEFLMWHPTIYNYDLTIGKDMEVDVHDLAALNPDRIELIATGEPMERAFTGGLITSDNRFYFFQVGNYP